MNKTQTVTPATSTSGAVTAVIVVYTVSRLALLLAADAISSLHTNLPIPRVLAPWDGTYYIGILKSGYPIHVNPASVNSEPIAFFPFYPLLGKAITVILSTHASITLEVVAMIAGGIASVFATLIAREYSDPATARRTGILFALFPGSVISVMAYADSLAVMFSVAAIFFLMRKRYIVAGIAAGLATATLSLMLLPLLLFILIYGIRNKSFKSLITLVLTGSGGGAYLLYLWISTGSLFTWSRVEADHWMVRLSWPWEFPTAFSAYAFTFQGSYVLTVASIVVTALGLYALWRMRAPIEWFIFSIAIIFAITFDGGAWIAPRFLYDTPPMIIALSMWGARKNIIFFPLCFISFCCLLGLLFAYSPGNMVFLNP